MSIHRINPKKVDDLIETPGKHCDGGGLYLQVADNGAASYVWRHKETWRSIGPASVYKIEEARDTARELRKDVHEGRDPFQRLTVGRARPVGKTFAEAMAEYLKAKAPTWAASNRKRELRRYEFLFNQIPDFTALPVKAIDQDAKNRALATWDGKAKAREDVGFYIEAIIRYALTGKIRLRAAADDVRHHEAMAYRDVPVLYTRLSGLGTVDARALQWVILTGARADEVIGAEFKAPATWGEIADVDGLPTWIIPGSRMKGRNMHRVPLTNQMIALLGECRADDVPLFKVPNEDAMRSALRANGGNGFAVHGMRSSFSNWVIETTNYGSDLADMCIAHLPPGKVRRAYQRSDLLVKRRQIMQEWSDFVAP